MPAENAENTGRSCPGVKMNNPACRIVLCTERDCYRIEKRKQMGPVRQLPKYPNTPLQVPYNQQLG